MKCKEENTKTRMSVAEAGTGSKVWMIIEQVHQTKPLLVTIGNQCTEMHLLMPQYYIEIHDRDGMEGKNDFHKTFIRGLHSLVSANDICYVNEEDAQEELDKRIKQKEEWHNKEVQMYKEIAQKFIDEHGYNLKGDALNNYLEGFVDCALHMRNHRYLLDKTPKVEGIEEFKSFEFE